MQAETKSCQNCKKDFTIEPEDFSFYEKMKVPPPTWCPECRMIRRFSFQNTWNLNWRNCEKCGDRMLSVYEPEAKMIVWCLDCWWSDAWDGSEYAMDYDPSHSFLEQVKELTSKTPFSTLQSEHTTLKNSGYSNDIAWSKDCYLVFWADYCDNVFYSSILNNLKYSADCLRAQESELCYEAVGINKCYQTFFSEECDACVDVWFSRNCYGCTDCIGCANLRGVSNCIFNVKYSKEEYIEKLKEFGLDSWNKLCKLKKSAREFWLTKPKREYNGNSLNKNITGEYVFNSKNSKEMYICVGTEDCKWTQFITVKTAKDCMDYSGWGNNSSRIYECINVGENSDSVYFSCYCWLNCIDTQYSYWSMSGKNNFGCVNLKRKKYCILNKEYSKEEYEKLKDKIIEDMKKNPYIDKLGREFYYGEFFPLEFSKFSYNKSNAMRFFPKTKEEALKEGYDWSDKIDSVYQITIKTDSLLDTIKNVNENILNEVIECENCKRGYKIAKGELSLLHKINLPLPHECPKCRENKRFSRQNSPKLYKRICAKCEKEINTAFSPDRPEIVYCVKCYQAEFL